MKTPTDVITGSIVEYDPIHGEMTIKANYPDWMIADKREYRKCLIQLIDGRPLSDKQRKACYKLIREIANYQGNGVDRTKEELKQKFAEEELHDGLDSDFSLSDAPMSTVCAFQRWLVRLMLDWDIPCSFPLLNFVDDTQDYLYSCLTHKRCCICGKTADLHHSERIGMGRDREEIIHEGMEVLPLCRIHHNEDHQIGESRFRGRYHIEKGVILDAYLCRLYQLKRKEEAEYAEPYCSDGPTDPRSRTPIYAEPDPGDELPHCS